MSFSQIGTPKIYINIIEWLALNNELTGVTNLFRTLPVVPEPVVYRELDSIQGMTANGFIALLGHDFATTASSYTITSDSLELPLTPVINGEGNPAYDGFSIDTFDGTGVDNITFTSLNPTNIGSVIIGSTYSMAHSPDMNLSIQYSTGTSTITTKGGADLSNTIWRPPLWGDTLGPWELNDPNSSTLGQGLAHSSRRTWSLKFSYLSKDSMYPKYNALNTLGTADVNTADPEQYTLLESNDFFSQVWNRLGSNLSWIFQPDDTVPEFAIVKFVGNSLKVNQVSNQIYSIAVKIRECW